MDTCDKCERFVCGKCVGDIKKSWVYRYRLQKFGSMTIIINIR